MTISYSAAVISDRLQALTRALDAGAGAGKLTVYGGTQPTAGGAASGAALVVLTFPKPSLNSVSGGLLTLKNPAAAAVAVDGVATWARLSDSGGVWVADVNVGAAGTGAAIEISASSAQLYAGADLAVTVATLAEV